MSDILLISGSPSTPSRSGALLQYAAERLNAEGFSTDLISVRDYPAEDLILGKFDSPSFADTKRLVAEARGLIVATPVYKAAYAGSLKTLLDILRTYALRNKTVLPLATGGSPAHLLVLDYALKPVLGALGASDILQGVYVIDEQIQLGKGDLFIDLEVRERFHRELNSLTAKVKPLTFAQAQILTDLGLSTIRLMSDNPARATQLAGYDLAIVGHAPLSGRRLAIDGYPA